ncbi:Iron-sulfur assembly protein 1 [Candida viswanathii]|uniref:Iron-sulfur assembly protein 1 n=1 Tax=Candida viswanathii TaxID=5486 RepID=A0A367XV43_9ASCO|nr:Iron-sulfur assembly protein 1 [Candida viswanathii]
MIARRQSIQVTRRFLSNPPTKNKRFMQTIPISTRSTSSPFLSSMHQDESSGESPKWAKHSLSFPKPAEPKESSASTTQPVRRSRTSRFASKSQPTFPPPSPFAFPSKSTSSPASSSDVIEISSDPEIQKASSSITTKPQPVAAEAKPATASTTPATKKKRVLRPRKALITLSGSAVEHLRALLNQPNPKLIRIGVRNRGCSGLTYNLEYVDKPGKFDELVEQDGVKVLIDSKALFSIVGSEMDWLDDKLSSRFIFKNPNSKGTCGCGESFMV